jgi:hypothetical protein
MPFYVSDPYTFFVPHPSNGTLEFPTPFPLLFPVMYFSFFSFLFVFLPPPTPLSDLFPYGVVEWGVRPVVYPFAEMCGRTQKGVGKKEKSLYTPSKNMKPSLPCDTSSLWKHD